MVIRSIGSLVVVSLTLGLVACGGSAETVTVTVEAEPVTVTAEAEAAEPATVTVEAVPEDATTTALDEEQVATDGALPTGVRSEPQTKKGITIQITDVDIAPGRTTVYVTVTNESGKPSDFSYVTELVADRRQYNDGSTDLGSLVAGATTDSTYYFDAEVPADTQRIRLIARSHIGDFDTGELLEFDIPAQLG